MLSRSMNATPNTVDTIPGRDMTPTTYNPFQKFLHWTIFLLVIGLYGLTYVAHSFPKGDPAQSFVWGMHISFGLVLLTLVAMRVLWRLVYGAPGLPADTPPLEALAAKLAHLALYALIIVIPVMGVFLVWLNGHEPSFFGLFSVPSPVVADKALGHNIEKVHEFFANLILALVGLHALAALWHHYIKKDNVLTRMMPGWRAGQQPN